jgi:hypothetical protein
VDRLPPLDRHGPRDGPSRATTACDACSVCSGRRLCHRRRRLLRVSGANAAPCRRRCARASFEQRNNVGADAGRVLGNVAVVAVGYGRRVACVDSAWGERARVYRGGPGRYRAGNFCCNDRRVRSGRTHRGSAGVSDTASVGACIGFRCGGERKHAATHEQAGVQDFAPAKRSAQRRSTVDPRQRCTTGDRQGCCGHAAIDRARPRTLPSAGTHAATRSALSLARERRGIRHLVVVPLERRAVRNRSAHAGRNSRPRLTVRQRLARRSRSLPRPRAWPPRAAVFLSSAGRYWKERQGYRHAESGKLPPPSSRAGSAP